jgi:Tfp pilus assembly protein PilN
MWNKDLSLGIDISDKHVSVVLLSRYRDKISVVKAASQSLAASTSGGDDMRTAQRVGRAIRQLLSRSGIRGKKAWVSFGSPKLLLQMVDLPEQIPSNLGQYLRRQIRNSTFLNSKNPCLDFAAIEKSESRDCAQCLVAAIDPQPIETLVKSLSIASVNPQVIDISILSLYRALYKKQLTHGFKFHTLLFYLHGQDVYLAVIRKSNLDYIRHLDRISENQQVAFEQWSAEQIRAVVQYYETEFIAQGQEELPWQFILASEGHSGDMEKLRVEIEKSFGPNLVYVSDKTAANWLPIENNPGIDALPLAAAGAALRKWFGSGLKTEMDLLPEQTRKIRFVIDYCINTAKIAAAVILLILFFAYGLNARASNIRGKLDKNSQVGPQKTLQAVMDEKNALMEQLDTMAKQKDQVETIIKGYPIECISGLLDQIRRRTPDGVRMTQLKSSTRGIVQIDGYCTAMEDIRRYAGLLETADYIASAQIRQSATHPKNPKLRLFTIICTLKEGI